MEEITHHNHPGKTESNYQNANMQEELIFQKLREKGYRITKQRQILLNVILQEECASCKEIYYKARKEASGIGAATVYRMINLLEEIGAISRKNMYIIPGTDPAKAGSRECPDKSRISSACMKHEEEIVCIIELDDHTACHLSAREWYQVMTEGLKACGYLECQNIANILFSPCLEMKGQKEDIANPIIERISQQEKIDGK